MANSDDFGITLEQVAISTPPSPDSFSLSFSLHLRRKRENERCKLPVIMLHAYYNSLPMRCDILLKANQMKDRGSFRRNHTGSHISSSTIMARTPICTVASGFEASFVTSMTLKMELVKVVPPLHVAPLCHISKVRC